MHSILTSKVKFGKAVIRGTGYGAGLDDCLQKLEESIGKFNVQVGWCTAQRLGEVHKNGIDALATVKKTQDGVEDVKKGRAHLTVNGKAFPLTFIRRKAIER
jgi:hypothetical protein